MRKLNIEELDSKIHDYALDIEYIDKQHLKNKLHQFLNFLKSQPISQRLLQRIEEDYSDLMKKIAPLESPLTYKQRDEILESLLTPDQQEAFGYFLINQTFNSDRIHENSYLNLTDKWYDCQGDFDQWKEDFNTYLFKPFIKLLNWYISESQSYNSKDYFSKKEVSEFSEKIDNLPLDDLLNDIRLGQEVLFEELQDLKEQLESLKKKNWGELLKGKLFDLTLSELILPSAFSIIVKAITGEDLKFLE